MTAPMLTLGLDPEAVETVVVVGSKIVSVLVDSGKVEGGIVDAGMVLPGKVVVYVRMISLPREEIGIADPTPDAVN